MRLAKCSLQYTHTCWHTWNMKFFIEILRESLGYLARLPKGRLIMPCITVHCCERKRNRQQQQQQRNANIRRARPDGDAKSSGCAQVRDMGSLATFTVLFLFFFPFPLFRYLTSTLTVLMSLLHASTHLSYSNSLCLSL